MTKNGKKEKGERSKEPQAKFCGTKNNYLFSANRGASITTVCFLKHPTFRCLPPSLLVWGSGSAIDSNWAHPLECSICRPRLNDLSNLSLSFSYLLPFIPLYYYFFSHDSAGKKDLEFFSIRLVVLVAEITRKKSEGEIAILRSSGIEIRRTILFLFYVWNILMRFYSVKNHTI